MRESFSVRAALSTCGSVQERRRLTGKFGIAAPGHGDAQSEFIPRVI
jgi:hypothetical protein